METNTRLLKIQESDSPSGTKLAISNFQGDDTQTAALG
jgi:hypothetical protein